MNSTVMNYINASDSTKTYTAIWWTAVTVDQPGDIVYGSVCSQIAGAKALCTAREHVRGNEWNVILTPQA